tara:strand:- start:154 stop:576 length:423 start_codon:yes stop_codon:yes gene_type:complete
MVVPVHLCLYGLKSKDLLEREGHEGDDHHLTTREETDTFKAKYDVKTTPQTFIGKERIGGYDDLSAHFGNGPKKTRRNDLSARYRAILRRCTDGNRRDLPHFGNGIFRPDNRMVHFGFDGPAWIAKIAGRRKILNDVSEL